MQTIETDNCVLELGADSLLVEKPAIASLLERLNLSGDIVDQQPAYRGARIVRGGKLRPVPPEFRLFAPRSIPALVRNLNRSLRLILDQRLILRGRDVLARGFFVLQRLDLLERLSLRHQLTATRSIVHGNGERTSSTRPWRASSAVKDRRDQ